MGRIGTLAMAAMGACLHATSIAAQEAPASRIDFYRVGEEFAGCTAHFAFATEVARGNGMDAAATAFAGMERGWSLAGMLLLVEGLDPSRQTEAEELFGNMKQIAVDHLRAEREVALANGVAGYDAASGERFIEQCGHWIELQQSIIIELRSGPTG
jgi:hypothetical protein